MARDTPTAVVDAASLSSVAARVRACTLCPLHESRAHAVPGEGAGVRGDAPADAIPRQAPWSRARGPASATAAGPTPPQAPWSGVMLVGEAPGRNEDATGRPFCGAAGKNLDLGLVAAELDRRAVFVTSIVKCRPPANRDPKPEEKAACRPYLMAQIDALRPRVVVALGRHGLSGLVAAAPAPFSALRGRFVAGPADGAGASVPVFCSLHPAAILYRRAWRQQYLDDWAWFGGWLRSAGPVPEDRWGAAPPPGGPSP